MGRDIKDVFLHNLEKRRMLAPKKKGEPVEVITKKIKKHKKKK